MEKLELSRIKYFDELVKLSLPREMYAIFSSACLALRGIRENNDIDIIVRPGLWNVLDKEYPKKNDHGMIEVGHLEISGSIRHLDSVDEVIDRAEIIYDYRFARLEDLLAWKRQMGRDKDLHDVKLIEEYLARGGR